MNDALSAVLPEFHRDRLAFVSLLAGDTAQLCLVAERGQLSPVGEFGDLTELIRATECLNLAEALAASGVGEPFDPPLGARLGPPARPDEAWAAGVTYRRSRDARVEESVGHASAYDEIYEADRPELFLKSTAARVRGPGETIGLRGDSTWQVPEAELALVIGAHHNVLGYLLGNDVSCRDIEGDNTLYLPQAKIFNGSCAIGPTVVDAAALGFEDITVGLRIRRDGQLVVEESVDARMLKRSPDELVRWLVRDNDVPAGTVLMTGTGIVPDNDFSLAPGDEVEIHAEQLGTLINRCVPAKSLTRR